MKLVLTKNKGFSLVETLVAIAILLITVAGPLTVAHKSLFSANTAKSQMIATFLAQDAIEYLKNLRDESLLNNSNNWVEGFDMCTGTCFVDTINKNVSVCGSDCPNLRKSDSGVYAYDPDWDESHFLRVITVEILNSNEAQIQVTLSWPQGIVTRTLEVGDNILKWSR